MGHHNNGSKDNGPAAKDNGPSPRTMASVRCSCSNNHTKDVILILFIPQIMISINFKKLYTGDTCNNTSDIKEHMSVIQVNREMAHPHG